MAKSGRVRLMWGVGMLTALVVGAVSLSMTNGPTVQALTSLYVSPNPNEIINKDTNNPDSTFRHILKRENSSTTDLLQMTAYFSSPNPGELIRITDRETGGHCGVTGSSSQHIQVTIDDGVSSITYNIARSRICSPASATGTNRRNNPNGAFFFGAYEVPASFTPAQHPTPDPDTNLYPLRLTIKFNPSRTEVPDGVTGQDGNRQVVTFKVRLNSCATAGCTKYISTKPIGASQRNYSTLGQVNDQHFTTQYFKFGLPCQAVAAQRLTVNVYDVDNHADWGGISPANGRFWIERRTTNNAWVKLNLNSPGVTMSGGTFVSRGYEVYPTPGSGQTATVSFDLQPRTNYRLGVDNIYSGNLLGVGLPTDTIFGDLVCGAALDGRVDSNPASGPVEAGQALSLMAIATRNVASDFPSSYTYTWRTWFDDGDNNYEAGEAAACPYVSNGSVSNHILLGDRTLATCPNIITRATGNISQVCGTLIITANDNQTQVGTGAAPNGVTRCVRVGKYPRLEVSNGDVWAGGNFRSLSPTCAVMNKPVISSSQRQLPSGFYTSYATYGVTSLGTSKHFGSQGINYDTAANTPANNLVFGNTANGGNVDGFFYSADADRVTFPPPSKAPLGVLRCLNDPFDLFGSRIDPTSTNANSSIDISTLGGNTLLTSTSTVKLYATQPIPAGKKIVIYAPDVNLEIMSNITYADQAYSSINQIPQVVVMSGKNIVVHWTSTTGLNVGGRVTQLDGIYAARENLYTCDLIPLLNTCNTQLKINGAVLTGGSVVPLRTAGADVPDFSAMAEIFNLRPDVLLNQLPDAGNPSIFIKTMSEREVPPRF